MIRIGIELNHVVRNINKQILKYYKKDIDPSLDLEDIDEKDDAFKYAKFETLTENNDKGHTNANEQLVIRVNQL